jgi:uncharacterized protein (UPF0333 family)
MRGICNRRGQSTLEYAILILIVIVALLAMQVYLKRGVQGRMRESTDNIGEAYSPAYTVSEFTLTSASTTHETVEGPAQTSKTELLDRTDTRTGSETIPEYTSEYWPG